MKLPPARIEAFLESPPEDIAVALVDSGLTSTIDTATWDVALSEQMTGLGDTGQVLTREMLSRIFDVEAKVAFDSYCQAKQVVFKKPNARGVER